jgi:hypothetical protein
LNWKGFGRLSFGSDDNDYYQGQFINGEIEGRGTRVWSDGKSYVGDWKNGEKNGLRCLFRFIIY